MKKYLLGTQGNVKDDMLSGLTVALALVPEAVAFAFVAGIPPMIGLYGAFMVGLITSLFGGRPGMISGATGALAVVMVDLIIEGNEVTAGAGLQYLFATLILMGVIQGMAGVLRLGKFVRLIPHPVMLGFVNGLAIVIFLSQLGMFKVEGAWLESTQLMTMAVLVVTTMAIMFLLPKVTKKIPAGLVAILFVSVIVIAFNINTETVQSFVTSKEKETLKTRWTEVHEELTTLKASSENLKKKPADMDAKIAGLEKDAAGFQQKIKDLEKTPSSLQGQLPVFAVPIIPLSWKTLLFIFPYALILAAIGLIESLMTLSLIDEMTETRGRSNRECAAQGLANIVNGFFGGMGGCAMIGQSMININSGGRGRLAGLTASLTLLSFILFLSPYIEQIPIAALVGVMFMVVIGTFAWSSFRIIRKIPRSDAFVLILVSSLTVVFDLAIAVICGVIVSALVFSWENAVRIRARKRVKEDGTKVYEIWGPLFFGSTTVFNGKFDIKNDPENVEIDFLESKVSDHSGIEAIETLVNKYTQANKKVTLKHLSEDCKGLLRTANYAKFDAIIEDDIDDPRYYVMTDTD